MTTKQTHVLVTGGAGYIGSVLCKQLLDRGYRVTVLDNFLYRQNSLLDCCPFETFRVVRGDCRDERIITDLLRDADVIIPLAALVGAPLCNRDRVGAYTINFEAVQMLTKLTSQQQQIIFPVTNSGYGIGQPGVACTEDSPLRPISLYGETKVKAERVVLDRGNAITLRLATVFGASPRMRMDLLVNDFVWRAVHDRAVVVFEGHCKRNYIHIRDVVKAFLHAMDHFESMKNRRLQRRSGRRQSLENWNCAGRSNDTFLSLCFLKRRSEKIPTNGTTSSRMNGFSRPGSSRTGR